MELAAITKRRLYWLSFVKLIVMPMAMAGLFYLIPVSDEVKTVMILATSVYDVVLLRAVPELCGSSREEGR